MRFIPNPATTEKLVRVKLGRGKAKLFRAPKVNVDVTYTNKDTAYTMDKNSCTVNALAIAAQVPWVVASNALKQAGRRPDRGFVDETAIKAGKIKGFKFTRVIRKPISLAKFLVKHPLGRFYVGSPRHAFAIVNGKVYDRLAKLGASRRIVTAYTVKLDNREGE